ncbi:urease accessory protein UreF [Actinopolymorpha pittospori]
MAGSHLLLMLLADGRLPVAGHTQSGQLEPAVRAGLTAEEVPSFVAARLATVVRVEAGTAVVGLHRLRGGLSLEPVVDAWAARTPAPAMRASSRTLARAYLRLASRLWPDSAHVATVSAVAGVPRPIAIAAAAATAGLSPTELAQLVGYDDVQTITAAALKLLPLDPAVATGWAYVALPSIDALATHVAALTEPADIPASAAPQTDLWAQTHDRTTRRLFRA